MHDNLQRYLSTETGLQVVSPRVSGWELFLAVRNGNPRNDEPVESRHRR
jgi:hypothetical protein